MARCPVGVPGAATSLRPGPPHTLLPLRATHIMRNRSRSFDFRWSQVYRMEHKSGPGA